MGKLFRRLRYLINKRRYDRELQNDMEFHRHMSAEHGRGNFGNALRLREEAREAWGWTWLDRLLQDLHYGVRVLRKSPGFTLTATLLLAIGVGVNITAFSLFDVLALQTLPVKDPKSLVRLQRRSPEIQTPEMPYPSVEFFRAHAQTLKSVVATMGAAAMRLGSGEQQVSVSYATANYFQELGSQMAVGRYFLDKRDGLPDAAPVVVLSYGAWQSRFGGDAGIVGKVIRLNNKPVTVIGVTGFSFASPGGHNAEIWLPLNQQPYFVDGSKMLTDAVNGSVRVWARLAPGATVQTAAQELLALTNERRKENPALVWDKEYIQIDSASHLQVMENGMYTVAALVAALVLLILCVACSNLGGLMIARGVAREREIAIRLAVGANRRRIFKQLLTEALLLAMLGAAAGLALGCAAMRVILVKVDAPGWMSAAPSLRTLIFTVAIASAAALFFGLAPAFQIARQRYRKALARQILVGVQLAASCVLMIVSGLLVRAVNHVLRGDPGFGYQQVVSIAPGLESHGYSAAKARTALEELRQQLQATPGVESVALSKMPLLGHGVTSLINIDTDGRNINVYPNWVDPGFFQLMEIRLLRGRTLLPGEKNAVVISESFAKAQWPGQDPLGKPLWRDKKNAERIVGIVRDARVKALNDSDAVEAYWAIQESDLPATTLLVKTAGAPEGMTKTIRNLTEKLDPKLFASVWLLKAGFRDTAKDVERLAFGVSSFGLIATAMAAIGILGLIGYAVSQQRKEIAIRLALGAKNRQVQTAVLRHLLWPLLFGITAGAIATAFLSTALRKGLYGISNLDPASYVVAISLLVIAVLLAGFLPTRQVLRLNLSETLHYQ
jgi:predicted permease